MESWDIRSLEFEPHRSKVLRSDDEARAIAIRLRSGEELQGHHVHERTFLLVADVVGSVSGARGGDRRARSAGSS